VSKKRHDIEISIIRWGGGSTFYESEKLRGAGRKERKMKTRSDGSRSL